MGNNRKNAPTFETMEIKVNIDTTMYSKNVVMNIFDFIELFRYKICSGIEEKLKCDNPATVFEKMNDAEKIDLLSFILSSKPFHVFVRNGEHELWMDVMNISTDPGMYISEASAQLLNVSNGDELHVSLYATEARPASNELRIQKVNDEWVINDEFFITHGHLLYDIYTCGTDDKDAVFVDQAQDFEGALNIILHKLS